jgi:hypothetical protein
MADTPFGSRTARGSAPTLRDMSSAVSRWFTAEVARGVTNPPALRPSWLRRGPFDLVFLADVVIAVVCFATTDSWLETQNGRSGHPFSTEMLLL